MLIAVPAEVELVQREDILGEVIGNIPERAEFPFGGLFVRKQVCNLIIRFLPGFFEAVYRTV